MAISVTAAAAEHVGKNGDAVAAIDAVDRFDDVATTEIGVVFRADRHGFDLFLRTHYVFERRLKLVGKAPMGHKYQTNHRKLLVDAMVRRTKAPL